MIYFKICTKPSCKMFTLSGKVSKQVLTGSRHPNLEDLNRRMMSWRVAATTKYSCFRRNSFPSKNLGTQWGKGGYISLCQKQHNEDTKRKQANKGNDLIVGIVKIKLFSRVKESDEMDFTNQVSSSVVSPSQVHILKKMQPSFNKVFTNIHIHIHIHGSALILRTWKHS